MKLEFSRHIFEKNFKYQISWKFVEWEPSGTMSQILMKLEFSRHIFEKNLKYQISWKFVELEPSGTMSHILMKLEFSRHIFEKILKYQISWKFVEWEPSGTVRTDGRTDGLIDITKLIVANRNFANAPKNGRERMCLVWFTIRECHWTWRLQSSKLSLRLTSGLNFITRNRNDNVPNTMASDDILSSNWT